MSEPSASNGKVQSALEKLFLQYRLARFNIEIELVEVDCLKSTNNGRK